MNTDMELTLSHVLYHLVHMLLKKMNNFSPNSSNEKGRLVIIQGKKFLNFLRFLFFVFSKIQKLPTNKVTTQHDSRKWDSKVTTAQFVVKIKKLSY